jgi:hypothetical protein
VDRKLLLERRFESGRFTAGDVPKPLENTAMRIRKKAEIEKARGNRVRVA